MKIFRSLLDWVWRMAETEGAMKVLFLVSLTESVFFPVPPDLLLIPTGVEKVAINFGTPRQQWLDTLTVEQAQALVQEGQFGVGSMQPKVEAILDFVNTSQQQGKYASGLITSPQAIKAALSHQSGTWITP